MSESLSTILVKTRWGAMEVIEGDAFVGGSLAVMGEYSPVETKFLRMLAEGQVVVDVGANIGALTVPLAQVAKKVYAFEPQRAVFELLQRNVERCGVKEKVVALQKACGAESGRAALEVVQKANWGSATLKEGNDVEVVRLDDVVEEKVGLLKVDVEGVEREVLQGAERVLEEGPLVFVEADREESGKRVVEFLKEREFELRWFISLLWKDNNFRGCKSNPFGLTCSFNLLGWKRGSDWDGKFEGLPKLEDVPKFGSAPLDCIVRDVYAG